MGQRRWSILIFPIVGVLLLILLAIVLAPVVVCRDWAFICENTASRKGYREWMWGSQTAHWCKESALESFMREKHPTELRHRWTSYAGTGKNIFGSSILYGHGRPGAVKYVDAKFLQEYLDHMEDVEKKGFYDLLASDNQDAVRLKVDAMFEELVERRSK